MARVGSDSGDRSDWLWIVSGPRARAQPCAGTRMALRAGGIAVEANVAPHPAVVLSRDARCVRIAVVSGVRFLREVLEILERDPLVSVVGLYSDLIEAVAGRPTLQADLVLVDETIPEGPTARK